MWLIEEAWSVVLPTAIVAAPLVVCFEWRAKLLNGVRDERTSTQK